MGLENIKITNLSKISYDCFLQQLLVLCQYYYGEYWKLFLEENFVWNNESLSCIKNTEQLNLKHHYIKAMNVYYGISLIEEEKEISFEKGTEIYIVSMDAINYPLYISSILNEIDHFFLVYEETEKYYVINDNYYGNTAFLIEKTFLNKNIKKLYRVQKNMPSANKDMIAKRLHERLETSFSEKWRWLCLELKNENIYDSAILLNYVKMVSGYVVNEANVLMGCSGNNIFIKEGAMILLEVAEKINTVYYSILKQSMKVEEVETAFLIGKSKQIQNYLLIQDNVKTEIKRIIEGESTIIDELIHQIEYFLEKKINIEEKLYEDKIDQYLLLALISYFEMENNIKDIDVMSFDTDCTYKELIVKIFRYILNNK